MEKQISFQGYAIVACGTLTLELSRLRESGFLDAGKILYTKPGRHEIPRELESQLIKQIANAKQYSKRIIIVYEGKFCYVDATDLSKSIDTIIQEQGQGICRIKATHCIDMLVGAEERKIIAKGKNVYWLTPGWIKYRKFVYQDWDKGKANENFPRHSGGAILLDAVGYYNELMERNPEAILEFSDWMGIPITPYNVTLNRFKTLLAGCVVSDLEGRLADMEKSLPPHSVKPSMIQQVEDLEEKLEKAKKASISLKEKMGFK